MNDAAKSRAAPRSARHSWASTKSPRRRRSPACAVHRASPRQRVGYLLPFEIVSVHLLVVLIGAAYLARAKRRREVTP